MTIYSGSSGQKREAVRRASTFDDRPSRSDWLGTGRCSFLFPLVRRAMTLGGWTHRRRYKWTRSQHGNGVADSLPSGSGDLDVQRAAAVASCESPAHARIESACGRKLVPDYSRTGANDPVQVIGCRDGKDARTGAQNLPNSSPIGFSCPENLVTFGQTPVAPGPPETSQALDSNALEPAAL